MPSARPNILLVTCHDLGPFLGCYGITTVRTPHIDALARDGVKFTRAFCTAPQCSPSRASLYTGRYPHSNGVMGLTHSHFAWDLKVGERHLAGVLREAGYRTALVGVHHEVRHTAIDEVARRCGFDVALGGPANKEPPGRVMTEQTVELLEELRSQDAPFYLQLGLYEPHRIPAPAHDEPDYMGFVGDYIEPDDSLGVTIPPYIRDTPQGRAELAELQGAVRYADACVGTVLDKLRDLGLEQDTLVIMTTDHGVALPRAKCSVYDPGLEIALVLRYPGRGWSGGRVYDELVSNLDLFPTLLEALGLPVSPDVQGRSILGLLDGADFEPREAVFAEMTYHDYYDPVRAVRTPSHKLIVNFTAAPSFMNPSQSWRPRTDPVKPAMPALDYHAPVELYDLRADPWERENLAEDPAHRATRDELLGMLHSWMVSTEDPLLAGAVTSPMHREALDALADNGREDGRGQ